MAKIIGINLSTTVFSIWRLSVQRFSSILITSCRKRELLPIVWL